MKKVFSYSLWNSSVNLEDQKDHCVRNSKSGLYVNGAVMNAEFIKQYPEWTCRIYHDDSITKSDLKKLKKLGVQLIRMPYIAEGNEGMLWRHLAIDDADITIVRELDEVLNHKIMQCFEHWVKSDRKFARISHMYRPTEMEHTGFAHMGFKGTLSKSVVQLFKELKAGGTLTISDGTTLTIRDYGIDEWLGNMTFSDEILADFMFFHTTDNNYHVNPLVENIRIPSNVAAFRKFVTD